MLKKIPIKIIRAELLGITPRVEKQFRQKIIPIKQNISQLHQFHIKKTTPKYNYTKQNIPQLHQFHIQQIKAYAIIDSNSLSQSQTTVNC